jgi:hypothetical protein
MRPRPGRPCPPDHRFYGVVRPDDATATYQDLSLKWLVRFGESVDWPPGPAHHWIHGIYRQESGTINDVRFSVWPCAFLMCRPDYRTVADPFLICSNFLGSTYRANLT